MLDKIIAFSIKNKFLIFMLTVALIIWGSISATKIPIDAVPDITNNQVQIITLCPALATQEVEQLVTYTVEQSLANLPKLEEIRSISRFGLSVITVVFEEDVDIYFGRQLINEKLKEAEALIPDGIGTPELAPVSSGLGEVYQYIIHPAKGSEDKYSAMDLRTMQDWIVARQLYGTPGIAEVNSFGGELKQYEVAVNPDRLLAMGVNVTDIFSALEKNNENTGGAYIDKKPNAYFIRGIGLISSFSDIENIMVKSNPNGIPVLIKDVAEVRFGSAIRYGAMTYNGKVDAVGGVVMMLKGANSSEVVKLVKERMSVIQSSLPDDVTIEAYLDRTDLVNRAISTVEKNLVEGALIVIFVLVLFLGNIRAGIIVASAIPLSMLFALGMMNFFGVSANLMSLGAIDFGLIVDGAVIMVEATLHHLGLRKSAQPLTQIEMDSEVFNSASKIRKSAAFGEVIILIVYIPILTLVGIEGKMFRPMAQTVGFAILGALILSLTYIPMMCALFLSKKPRKEFSFSTKMMNFFHKIYEPMLEAAIRFRKTIVAATILLFGIAVMLYSKMGSEFIPTLAEGDFAFHCILPQGTSLSQSIETSMFASRLIGEFNEVKMVVGKTGSAEVPTDPMPPEATDMMIILKPLDEWESGKSYDELADDMMTKLQVIPGVFFEKSQPIQMRFNELMTGIRQDVAIKIFGENMDTLLNYAGKVEEMIHETDGATDPAVERVQGLPQINIRYDRARMSNYGINIDDINHVVSMAFAGGIAGVVIENERKFDLVVRLDTSNRQSIDDVSKLYIPASNGAQIPLSQVADIRMELAPAQISREDGKRRIVIGFNVVDRDVTSVVEDIQKQIKENLKLPEGYFVTYGGTFENLKKGSERLLIAVPAALALIFILLFFTFNSLKQALIIFAAIPMSAIGGVFALLLRDMPFSISAGIGFIALFGVAVLNGIVLVGTFNQLEKDGMTDLLNRIREGTKIRLRPVLMTAAVASLGFLPMALSTGAGAEVQKPLATVVIGGLISATFLTLFVLPLIYLTFSRKKLSGALASISVLIVLCFSGSSTYAQNLPESLTLDEVISLALIQNAELQAQQLNVDAKSIIRRSSFEMPKTELNFEYGQFNSGQNDNSFQISQDIPFPTIFSKRSQLFEEELKGSELQMQVSVNNIRTQVKSLYTSIEYLNNRKKELQFLDTLYSELVTAATIRFNSGETNLLAKTTAEVKRGELLLLLKSNEAEIEIAYSSLRSLVNSGRDFVIAESVSYKPLLLEMTADTSVLNSNPSIKLMYQNAEIVNRSMKLESAEMLPDLTLGYANQSIIGLQNIEGAEVYYGGGKRFSSFNVGIKLPLTFFNGNARIESKEVKQKSLLKEAENGKLILRAQLEKAYQQYSQGLSHIKHYEELALPNSEIILSTARISYASGEIGYIEFLQSLQTVTDIRLGYLDSINELNQTVIGINSLINK
ncbi:MAG: CusA/CzcA family heavy metal efflux RND transporter [Ignavibacteria bacterium]|nr:CusA/CzcA family heavy metal efflux RND transporter [Ignavibacteria bacterium]